MAERDYTKFPEVLGRYGRQGFEIDVVICERLTVLTQSEGV